MKKLKILKIVIIFNLLIVNIFSKTEWTYSGINDGGLMILYKTLPPLIVEVDEPEIMRIKKGSETFKYSNVTKTKKPLNVNIEIRFNNSIIEENAINKDIVQTIYDSVRLSFQDDGKFNLYKSTEGILPKNIVESIDGEVFFTDISGTKLQGNEAKILVKPLGNTIQGGVLSQNNIYIDSEFNKDKKQILPGNYSGEIKLEVEFIGKDNFRLW